jgi:putative membrane protein
MIKPSKAFAVSAALFMLLHPFAAIAQGSQSPPQWDWPGPWHMMWGGGWGFWWIFPLFMLFMFVMCVLFMMRGAWGHGHHSGTDATTSALQILNERFAKGEIKKEEYDEKKAAILRRI